MLLLLEQRDVLQAVAKWLTRGEAGKLLATLCKACAVLVQAADAAEEAGVPEFWLPMPPMWEMNLVHSRIDERWAKEYHRYALRLDDVLKFFVNQILSAQDAGDIELVFDRRQAREGIQASVLGCHTLRVLDPLHFLEVMRAWAVDITTPDFPEDDFAHAAVERFGSKRWRSSICQRWKTQFVVNLLNLLGLQAPRGSDMRFDAHEDVDADEVLWSREYVAARRSSRRQA
jgi:hypothetical protein